MNAGPPGYVIEAAREAALKSPCAKSKRGVALFNRARADQAASEWHRPVSEALTYVYDDVVVATGCNGPPSPFTCSGSDRCRRDCGKLCLHAEERAIRAAGALDDVADLELVHVEVVNDRVVPGGGPSCWQCSRLVVEVKLRGVWLYEHIPCPSDRCPLCNGKSCSICDADPWPQVDPRFVKTIEEARSVMRPHCQHDAAARHQSTERWRLSHYENGIPIPHPRTSNTQLFGEWTFYEAEQFHAETLRNEEVGDHRPRDGEESA